MTAALSLDAGWFRRNPCRAYRLRRQTPAEVAAWPTPPREGFTAWCIVRRADGAVGPFAMETGEAPDDNDFDLASLFFDVSVHLDHGLIGEVTVALDQPYGPGDAA